MVLTVMACQVLAAFAVEGEGPVRFGVPLQAAQVERTLRLRGGGTGTRLQWSVLSPRPGADGRVWVEVIVDGPPGRYRITAGRGEVPVTQGTGRVAIRVASRGRTGGSDDARVRTWSYSRSGAQDRVVRALLGPDSPGEWETTYEDEFCARRTRVRIEPGWWREVGVLPSRARLGGELRDELLRVLPVLPTAPGTRGRGDYVRGAPDESGRRTVTNLEFDTGLGFVRLGLVADHAGALRRAYDTAYHLVDRDLDRSTGLPYRHGRDHRVARPEPGHCWVRGLRVTALTFADRFLLETATSIVRALARHVMNEEPPRFLRDLAWPLGEFEAHLRFLPDDPVVREAADRLGEALLDRWDEALGVFRFDEGGRDPARYRDRCWQTGGILLPALRAWAKRRGSARAKDLADATEHRLVALIRQGKPGLPLSYVARPDGPRGASRSLSSAAGVLLLDGLSLDSLRRVLARRQVQRALENVLDDSALNLATDFSIVARCRWVMR